MIFCCERFQSRHESSREMGLNIRVVKFSDKELMDAKSPYRFFVSVAYKKEDRCVPTLNIAYCPFCAQNLFEFYKDDQYVNEEDDNFLYP